MARSTVAVRFTGDTADLKRATTDMNRRLGDTQSKFRRFGRVAAAGFAAAGVAGIAFAKSSVEAFAEAETAQAQLNDAFEKFPQLAGANADALRDLNEELAKKTRFDDDATASAQAVLAQFGLTEQQLRELTPLLQDYAARTGKDLTTAATDLGKAMLGQGRALKAVGIEFEDTGTQAGNFDQIMGGLNEKVGGFAENEGKTAAGQAEILKNQFGELQEKVGEALMPILQGLATVLIETVIPKLEDTARWLGENKGVAVALAGALGVLVLAYVASAVAGVAAAVAPVAPWLALVAVIIGGGLALQYVIDKFNLMPKAAKLVQPLIDKFGWLLDLVVGIDRFIGRIFKSMGPLSAAAGALTNEADPSDVQDIFDIINKNHAGSTSSGGPTRGRLAAGGRFSPGNWLVGENGPEVVTMGGSGYVTPNHQLGGDTYNISVTAEHEPVALAVVRELKRNKLLMAGA